MTLLFALTAWRCEASPQSSIHLVHAHSAIKSGDYKKAYGILKKASDDGCPFSSTLLGKMHASGKCAHRDLDRAVIYFERAAKADFGEAQLELGKLYVGDLSSVRDAGLKANRWLRLALGNGIEEARMLLEKVPYEDRVESALKDVKKRAQEGAATSQTGVVESYKGYADIVNTLNTASESK